MFYRGNAQTVYFYFSFGIIIGSQLNKHIKILLLKAKISQNLK